MRFEPVLDHHRDLLGEGPHWDAATATLLWVDIIAGRAQRLDPATGAYAAWTFGEPVSAVVPRRAGGLMVALRNRLAFLEPATGATTDFAAPEQDVACNRSNEARVDPTGRFWLGTMQNNLGPNGEDLPITASTGALYRIEPDGTTTRVLDGIGIANTLLWDEALGRLYFGDSLARTLWAFDWDPATGALAGRRDFARIEGPGVNDGSALDAEGCLWNARWDGGCLVRYRPDGTIDRVVDVPVRRPTSCVFGGPDRRTLFVTSAGAGLDGALDGALLAAPAPLPGQPCTAFAG